MNTVLRREESHSRIRGGKQKTPGVGVGVKKSVHLLKKRGPVLLLGSSKSFIKYYKKYHVYVT